MSKIQIFTVPSPGTSVITYPKEFYENLVPHEQETLNNLIQSVRQGTQYQIINGGYGDMENCNGIVEARIEPPDGGSLTKLWGCSYLFKGYPRKEITEGLMIAKAMASWVPRSFIYKSTFWKIALFIRFLFFRQRFWHDLKVLFSVIYWRILNVIDLKPNKFNRIGKELKRAGDATLKKMLDMKQDKREYKHSFVFFPWLIQLEDVDKIMKRNFLEMLAVVLEFFYVFIETDNAYRFRMQDVLPLLDKEALKKDPIQEVSRLITILHDRENPETSLGQRYKWQSLKRIVILAMRFMKDVRVFITEYLLELDLEKIKPDEADHYFMLRRKTYTIGGRLLEERVKEADQIDRDKKHARCDLVTVTDRANGQQLPAIRIIQP